MPSTISTLASTTNSASTGTTPSSTMSPVPTYVRNDGKRGLCYNNDSLTLPYAHAGTDSHVSWGYDWYYSRYSTPNDGIENRAMTFIPLLFNDNPSLTDVWHEKAQAAIDAGADALMSFNEPDSCYGGSACMSVNQSVAAYKKYMQPFAGIVPLGAPAVTNGGPPYGLTWLSEFIGNCSAADCQIDFINIHWYANSYAFTYLQSYIQEAHDRFGKPIWVTEIGMDGGKDLDTEENVEAFMRKAVSWLDAVPYVERYAWFIDAPGNLINDDGNGLSALGVIYNNYTSPCPDWQNTDGHC
ncbi:Putative glycoside hydrolase superfamily [Septoria linicola]|uniref:Glycoside hydrolase superfamily n=1 Tax=Septoria linicola TaxID=215465 RepID=A0A9Q9AIF9_9PEZI|nr:putative glycoside hydrolase superfamily [Septoria linicola]USW49655.1 Putative glycoside hydrolase superfamily [Septoria linicola]